MAINSAKQASTGFSPFYLNYGQEVQLPLDLALRSAIECKNPEAAERIQQLRVDLARAKEGIRAAQVRQSRYADQHRRAVTFAVGDRVLLSTEHLQLKGEGRTPKLTYKYIGPFQVRRVVGANAYELDLPSTLGIHPVLNVSRLKPYHDGFASHPDRPQPHHRPPPETVEDDGGEVYEVSRSWPSVAAALVCSISSSGSATRVGSRPGSHHPPSATLGMPSPSSSPRRSAIRSSSYKVE